MSRPASSLIIFSFLAFLVGGSYFLFQLRAVSATATLRNFEIRTGDGLNEIAEKLEGSKIIRSSSVFKIFSVLSGNAHLLKPGTYILNAASGTPSIINRIIEGPREKVTVAIIEGMTVKDIDTLLSKSGVIFPGAIEHVQVADFKKDYVFLKSARSFEGFLFPDTYEFFAGSDSETVVRRLLDTFQKKAWPLLQSVQNVRDIVTIASLIEKEVPLTKDRKIVAGILFKRLSEGVALQIDSTLSYIKCNQAFVFCSSVAVARKDTSLDSPYNTYLYNGLPPGPISNPGIDAITATLHPQTSAYWYYLSDPKTKKTIFSTTLDEHNENRAIYLQR